VFAEVENVEEKENWKRENVLCKIVLISSNELQHEVCLYKRGKKRDQQVN